MDAIVKPAGMPSVSHLSIPAAGQHNMIFDKQVRIQPFLGIFFEAIFSVCAANTPHGVLYRPDIRNDVMFKKSPLVS